MSENKHKFYRIYVAEFESMKIWTGNESSLNTFLRNLKSYDMYLVYELGRIPCSDDDADRFRKAIQKMGIQCRLLDARQMAEKDILSDILSQIQYYTHEGAWVYLLGYMANQYFSDTLVATSRMEVSGVASYPTYRTGRFSIPVSKVDTGSVETGAEAKSEQLDGPPAVQPEKAPSSVVESSQSIPIDKNNLNKDRPSRKRQRKRGRGKQKSGSIDVAENEKIEDIFQPDILGAADKGEDTGMGPFDFSAQKADPASHKPQIKKKPRAGEPKLSDVSLPVESDFGTAAAESFMDMVLAGMPSIMDNETSQVPRRAKSKGDDTPPDGTREVFPPPIENEPYDSETNTKINTVNAEAAIEDECQEKAEQLEETLETSNGSSWREDIRSGRARTMEQPMSDAQRRDAELAAMEKKIFGEREAPKDTERYYSPLDDSKAQTVALLADRLIQDIDSLVPGVKNAGYDYDAYMAMISTLIRSTSIEDFKSCWSVVYPGKSINLDPEIYRKIRKEAEFYAKACEVLYVDDVY